MNFDKKYLKILTDLTNQNDLFLLSYWLQYHKNFINDISIITHDNNIDYPYCKIIKDLNFNDENYLKLSLNDFLIINDKDQYNNINFRKFTAYSKKNTKYEFNNTFELLNNLINEDISFIEKEEIETTNKSFIINIENLINNKLIENQDNDNDNTKYVYDILKSKYKNKLFIVTGGCGFIGSHLVDELISQDHKVIVIDNLLTGNINNLNTSDNVIYENIDINNFELLNKTIDEYDNIDGIYHLAEMSDNNLCITNPLLCYNTNIIGCLNILEIARNKKINKVIISSTNVNYDNLTPYKISKNTIEDFVVFYIENYEMNITLLKYPNVYGKRQINNKVNDENSLYVTDIISANILSYYSNYNGILNLYKELLELSEKNQTFYEIGWKSLINIKEGIDMTLNNYSYDDDDNSEDIGFIILRHVINAETNCYWQLCYNSIRKHYPNNKIVIIDDNSNKEYLKSNINLYKTKIIESEYPKRGELLPYYYYNKNKFFKIAVILHDSTIINKYINFYVDSYAMLWDIDHDCDDVDNDTYIINHFNSPELSLFYHNKLHWKGCFGSMTVIKHSFLSSINDIFNFNTLLPLILTRKDRCSLERVIACIFQYKDKYSCLISCITNLRMAFQLNYENYINNSNMYNNMSIVKYWSGR